MFAANRIADLVPEITAWRRDLHAHPELLYDLPRTSAAVADRLRAFGFDRVITGLGKTGVVGVLEGTLGAGRAVALRADMDALPITEITGKPWTSTIAGRMHACGHDGHTAMLLGAAKVLAETRAFAGSLVFVFQPAEEGGGGARAMIEDGLFREVRIDEIYGMHNLPGLPVGRFATRPGPIMAAADRIRLEIEGRGGHAAMPHQAIDPVVAGAAMVMAAQTIVSRIVSPFQPAVLSLTCFNAGTTDNVIPQTATLSGTIRTLDETVRTQIAAELEAQVEAVARAHRVRASLTIRRGYPVTVNDAASAGFAADVAESLAGCEGVDRGVEPMMGAEDFSYYLQEKPGAFVFLGNGDSAGLHHPAYDFDDGAIAHGVGFWVELARRALAR